MNRTGLASPPHHVALSYLEELAHRLLFVPGDAVKDAIEILLEARACNQRIYVIGNGGSAAIATHFVCDLVKATSIPGSQPFRAYALTDNSPLLTAWANDTTYEQVFAQQITAQVDPGDVVVAISSSGSSPNIVAGLRTALEQGARTIAFVGFDGGVARDLAEVTIHVRCDDYGQVEDIHAALGHAITNAVRHSLTGAEHSL
jgi:D-sedoheptulose 7-phosphate isomerase